MFIFEEPYDLNDDWYLSEKHEAKLSNKLLKNMSCAHMLGIQFLFESYVKKRSGAILNEEEDLNMPLQVCAFLSTMKGRIDTSWPVLIVSSDYSICKWHYHASEVGFKPEIISSGNFDNTDLYILSSDSLKLAVNLLDQGLFCVVMDDLDKIVTKLLVKKLRGSFNIGLTTRNFYKKPDPKLKWSMLNWANPGCVGKLNDFYRIDRLHSLAFADNYRLWWMRVTWNFCNSFDRPNQDDLKEYEQKLQEWSKRHNINTAYKQTPSLKRSRNQKQTTRRKKKIKHDSTSTINFPNFSDSNSSVPPSPEAIIPKIDNSADESKEVQNIDDKQNLPDRTLSENVKTESTDITKSVESDEEIFLLDHTENMKKNECSKVNCKAEPTVENSVNEVKTEPTKDMETDEDEPILSIIYSRTTDNTSPKNSDNLSRTFENDSKFNLFSDTETSSKSQTFQQISDVLDKLSDVEGDAESNSDDDSFFSELITGKK